MYFLSKEQRSLLFMIMNDSYYLERVQYLKEFLEKTRDKSIVNDPKNLLGLQLDAAKFETELWNVMKQQRDVIKELRAKPKLTEQEKKDLARILEGLEAHQQLIRILRTIFDGVAWRTLGYNRLFLTSAARSTSAGAFTLDLDSSKSLFSWAHAIQEVHGGEVLINDLTRFLRIGDLTESYGDTAVIHELKKSGRKILNFKTLQMRKGSKVTDQTRKMLELQKVAFSSKITLPDGDVLEQRYTRVDLQTHCQEIEKQLKIAESQVVSRIKTEPFIQVAMMNLEKAYDRPEKMKKYLKSFRYTGWKTKWQFSHTNFDHFFYDEMGNFLRNQAPYSIFPFSDEICMKLMSGQFLIEATTNFELLADELRKRRWKVSLTLPDIPDDHEEKMRHIFDNREELFSNIGQDDGFIKIERGPFFMSIPQNWIAMMSMEFMTFDTLCNLLKEIYQEARRVQAPMTIHPEFSNAADVWN